MEWMKLLKRAIDYIEENITAPITLNDVSVATHLSKEYTARVFKFCFNG